MSSDNVLNEPGNTYTAASFKIEVPAKGGYDVYGWWLANRDYSSRTTLWIYSANGWVRKVVGQRTNGGRWVYPDLRFGRRGRLERAGVEP